MTETRHDIIVTDLDIESAEVFWYLPECVFIQETEKYGERHRHLCMFNRDEAAQVVKALQAFLAAGA